MADNLKERTIAIINDDAEFNSLPFEERGKILKYVSKFNIQLLYQIIESDKRLTTEAWREKKREHLKNLVSAYEREYQGEKNNG